MGFSNNPNKQNKPLSSVSSRPRWSPVSACLSRFVQQVVEITRARRSFKSPKCKGKCSSQERKSSTPLVLSPASPAVRSVSDFVVDVGRALRGHLLDNVDGVAIVAAHLLVVRAVVVLCPQRNDDVTGLRASRAPGHLGIGQRAE